MIRHRIYETMYLGVIGADLSRSRQGIAELGYLCTEIKKERK